MKQSIHSFYGVCEWSLPGKNKIRSKSAHFFPFKKQKDKKRGRHTPIQSLTYNDFHYTIQNNIILCNMDSLTFSIDQSATFTSLDEQTYCTIYFNAGKYLFTHCDGSSSTKCLDCGREEYQPDWNSDTKCIPQKFCDEGQCHLQFFSVALVHFSNQKLHFWNHSFNLHII